MRVALTATLRLRYVHSFPQRQCYIVPKPTKSEHGPTFESALAELENIVTRMEGGQLSLEQSLTAYKRGAELLKFCQAQLADAQQQADRAAIGHRERQPADVMLTKTGPKLLGFGLAQLPGAASPVSPSDEAGATTAGPGSAKGSILGTIH